MARKARRLSSTGIYHVMLRGINRAQVFYTNEDESKFIDYLSRAKDRFSFKIYAYCFMGNHVHLLVEESESGMIGAFMKLLLVWYVAWYNVAHHRCGSLFQTRYKSEPVEDAKYFQQVVRYIHRNPVKARKCRHVWETRKSSYHLYFDEDPGIVDRDEVFEKYIARDEFEEFNDCPELNGFDDSCMDLSEGLPFKLTNERASMLMACVAGFPNFTSFEGLGMDRIFELVKKYRQRGLSFGQIARELGKNKGTIFKWVHSCS